MYKIERGGFKFKKLFLENYSEVLDPIPENKEDKITIHYLISYNGFQFTTIIIFYKRKCSVRFDVQGRSINSFQTLTFNLIGLLSFDVNISQLHRRLHCTQHCTISKHAPKILFLRKVRGHEATIFEKTTFQNFSAMVTDLKNIRPIFRYFNFST